MLGISLGKGIDKSIANIKEQEHNRLVETSKREPKHKDKCDSDDDVESEIDSDLGLDHHAIQHGVTLNLPQGKVKIRFNQKE
jgi:hypothetical protein